MEFSSAGGDIFKALYTVPVALLVPVGMPAGKEGPAASSTEGGGCALTREE